MLLIFLVCSVLTILLVLIIGLILSHKIAGPIHNMKIFFQDKIELRARGKLAFRKGDFFLELPPIVNKFFEQQDQKLK